MFDDLKSKWRRLFGSGQTSCPPAVVSATASPSTDHRLSSIQQLILMQQFRQEWKGGILPRLNEVGFSVFSESDEDGILLFIFAMIGTTNKLFVDLGAGSISGSNTANLVLNHGWYGLLVDGDPTNSDLLLSSFNEYTHIRNLPPKIICQWITADNINSILSENGFTGEIDLLCIDIDGMDYWIWKAIDVISPRVIVVEYQCIWGSDVSVVVPYDPHFNATFSGRFGIYNSASLRAFEKLAHQRGYRLVGSQRYGYNAFFIRDDIPESGIPSVEVEECQNKPFVKWAQRKFGERIKEFEWAEI